MTLWKPANLNQMMCRVSILYLVKPCYGKDTNNFTSV